MFILPWGSAWNGHTEISRQQAANLVAALRQHGMKLQAAALDMGLETKDLGKQLRGHKPLSLWRLSFLPTPVYVTWLGLEVARFGGSLLTAEDRAFVLSAAQLGITKMLTIVPSFSQQQERKEA
jgi:hypothetical protein